MNANPEPYRLNEKAAIFVNHALVTAMMVCVSVTFGQIARRVAPEWQGGYLGVLAGIVSVEAIFSWRKTRRWTNLNFYGLAYWGIEWVVLTVFIKAFLYLAHGPGALLTDIPLWSKDFLLYFFTPETAFVLAVAFFIWLLSGLYAADLVELEGDEALINLPEEDRFPIDRSGTRHNLVSRVFTVGFVLLALTALNHFNFTLLRGNPDVSHTDLINLMVYFLLGLLLFSQTRLALLRNNWAWDRVPVSGQVTRSWTLFSLGFLAILTAFALVLPTGYSFGLLSTLGFILNGIGTALYFLLLLLVLPVFALFNFLMSLLFKNPRPAEPPPVVRMPELPPQAGIGAGSPWLEIVKSILFWVLLLGLIGFAFYQYFRQNQELIERMKHMPVLSWFVRLVEKLGQLMRGVNVRLGAAYHAGLKRLRINQRSLAEKSSPGFLRLRRLSPRQRVQFFYLAMVRRGGETGITRHASQTPYEYSHLVQTQVSEADQDLEAMTDAFVEARYSRHEITLQQARLVQQYWERVKRALREWRSRL